MAKLFLLLAASLLLLSSQAFSNLIIESPRETNWGVWGSWQRCPFGKAAQAVRLKTESYQGIIIDDTAANAIRLYCGDPSNPNTTYITSSEGTAGGWGSIYTCRSDGQSNIDGYITGFQLRVEGEGATDDTATNNLRVFCSFPSNGTLEQTLQADGGSYGSWTTARKCQQSNQRVCAIRTQVEPYQGVTGDDTALNNVQLECCDM